ncbi:hypothetical protein SLE2022_352850 [Rubroshorea leprosula]
MRVIDDSPLRSYIVGPVSKELLTMTVARAITPNKEWDVEMLMNWLPLEFVNEIRALPLSSQAPLEDAIYWVGTSGGSFTTKSAFQLQQRHCSQDTSPISSWKWI